FRLDSDSTAPIAIAALCSLANVDHVPKPSTKQQISTLPAHVTSRRRPRGLDGTGVGHHGSWRNPISSNAATGVMTAAHRSGRWEHEDACGCGEPAAQRA